MPDYPLQNLFFDFEEEEVLAIRKQAKKLVTDGKTIMKVSAAGNEAEKQFTLPVAQVLMECRAALKHIDPAKYGKRVKRTYASFRRQYPYS